MPTKSELTNEQFQEGCRLKDVARKDTNHLETFVEAAKCMHSASSLSFEIAEEPGASASTKLEAKACGLYFLSEHHSCLGSYFYEKRDTAKSKVHQEQSQQALKEAINLVENTSDSISKDTLQSLKQRLPTWKYIHKVGQASLLASDARRDWDSKNLINALDLYRQAARIESEAISIARQDNLPLSYQRIAIGNYLGMMANASNALTQIILQKGTIGYEGLTKLISPEATIDLIRYTLDAHRLFKLAFDGNPEWEQFTEFAAASERNIRNFLTDNPSSWLDLYLAFEYDPEFQRIMKMTDIKRFKDVEFQRTFRENKVAKLWQVGSFWLLVLVVVAGVAFFFATSNLGFFSLLVVFVTCEVLIILIGAFTLRTVGELSEQGFLKLIRMALQYQFKFDWLELKKNSGQKGNGI